MNLRCYVSKNNFKYTNLAKKLLISPIYLSAIARGERICSRRLAIAIEMLTKGQVKADEVLSFCRLKTKKGETYLEKRIEDMTE